MKTFLDKVAGEDVDSVMLAFVIAVCFCVFFGSRNARLLYNKGNSLLVPIFNFWMVVGFVLFIILLAIFVIHVKREFFD